MEPLLSLGPWIKHCRRLDLTQAELAAHVGIATTSLPRIEADERRPSGSVAQRLADQFQLTLTDRTAFLRSIRAEIAPDQLALPALRSPSLTARSIAIPAPAAALVPPGLPDLPSGTMTFLGCTAMLSSNAEIYTHPEPVSRLRQVLGCVANCITHTGGSSFSGVPCNT